MPRTHELCRKCGKEHWNFDGCGTRKKPPHILRRPRQDGLSEWTDRFETVERNGNVYFLKDNQPERGNLTGPEGWTPPTAA